MALPASQLARLVSRGAGPSAGGEARAKALPVGPLVPGMGGAAGRGGAGPRWLHAVDGALPDGGLPRGAVVELASPLGLARATTVAVAACAAAQEASRAWSSRAAWCAWLDPWSSLHAPGIRAAGVELERLLVVRPSTATLARTAARVVASGAFAVVVIDTAQPLCGGAIERATAEARDGGAVAGAVRLDRWPPVVRRLALAVEGSDTTVLLLTDLGAARGLPLPVAMRIELDRHVEVGDGSLDRASPDRVPLERRGVVARSTLRIAKERHGRIGGAVPLVDGPLLGGALLGAPLPLEDPLEDEAARPAGGLRPALRSATSGG